ncbi:protein zwilch [Drosophila kikkawai]|uniref:Protein zwilch n=1 Tax=Drosophila kikkawai TaxID=30033 RepID=A0A6P4JI27_DROKI|nr:protein zwilch [Drosophila kikkawai]
MSASLANVYAELMRRYGETFTITYGPPPTYLANIVGAAEAGKKIVLLFREERSGAAASRIRTTPVKRERKSDGTSELDLTGSPLKDDCEVEAIGDQSLDLQLEDKNPWKLEEEYHRGVPVDKARAIICRESFQKTEGLGSVWFLCDAEDLGQTQLLQYEFDKSHFSRGVLSYQGVVPAYTVTSQSLVRKHSPAGGHPAETIIENTYAVNSNMMLRVSHSTNAPLPLLINLHDCEVTLNNTFHVGDCTSLTRDFMVQLRILVYIREDIVNYHKDMKQGIARDPNYRCGVGIDMDELREAINKTMTDVSGFSDLPTHGLSGEADIEDVVHRAKIRRITDLTDKLWELLKCCDSYKDLKMAFNILFQCAARCNIVNTPTNKNRLAEIIKELANRRLAIPCLSGAEPLELLLEIGLEKVYKDYEFIYTESKLCSTNLLKHTSEVAAANDGDDAPQNLPQLRKSLHNAVRGDPTPGAGGMRKTLLHHNSADKPGNAKYASQDDDEAGFKNSHFDERESMERVSKLFQIHCTLEHLLMIQVHLNLPNAYSDICSKLLKKTPCLLEAIDDQLSDEMDITLSAHCVASHLDGKEPYSRQITMRSYNKFREMKTTFYYNSDNICPPNLVECFQSDDKKLVKERTYHSWLYRKIRTLQ